jgi:hypothetical protein
MLMLSLLKRRQSKRSVQGLLDSSDYLRFAGRIHMSDGDDSASANARAIELLLVITVKTSLVKAVTGTPLGERHVFDIEGGTFDGPKLSGRVPATGGDWVTRIPQSAAQLSVRMLLETHDGVTILFQYSGRAGTADGKLRIEVAGTFDAPRGPYDWLNEVQAFGRGTPTPDGVRYHFYRFE